MEQFQPNANNILDVLYNKKPKYLPLYEHHIDIEFIEKFTGEELIGYRETGLSSSSHCSRIGMFSSDIR